MLLIGCPYPSTLCNLLLISITISYLLTTLYIPPASYCMRFLLSAFRIEETSKQLFWGKLKSPCEVYSTYTCALLHLDCMQTQSLCQYTTMLLSRTYHPLFSRIVHGIINCRRRQLAVTCRCLTTCSCLGVLAHS